MPVSWSPRCCLHMSHCCQPEACPRYHGSPGSTRQSLRGSSCHQLSRSPENSFSQFCVFSKWVLWHPGKSSTLLPITAGRHALSARLGQPRMNAHELTAHGVLLSSYCAALWLPATVWLPCLRSLVLSFALDDTHVSTGWTSFSTRQVRSLRTGIPLTPAPSEHGRS